MFPKKNPVVNGFIIATPIKAISIAIGKWMFVFSLRRKNDNIGTMMIYVEVISATFATGA